MDDRKSERKILLDKAAEYVLKERNAAYGEPTQDFERIAKLWDILFNSPKPDHHFQSHHVAIAMICLKLSRLTWSPGNFDSWVDIAGYAACGWETVVEEEKRKNE